MWEEYLAECDPCARRAYEVGNLLEVGRHWEAHGYGQAYRLAGLDESLGKAEAENRNPEWVERIRSWRGRLAASADVVAGVLSQLASDVGAAARKLEKALPLDPARPLRPAAVRTRGAIRPRGSAHARLPVVVTLARGQPPGPVVVEAEGSTVVVRLEGWPEGEEPGLVALAGVEGEEAAAVREAIGRDTGGVFVVEFGGLGPGRYVLLTENS